MSGPRPHVLARSHPVLFPSWIMAIFPPRPVEASFTGDLHIGYASSKLIRKTWFKWKRHSTKAKKMRGRLVKEGK